MKAVPITVKEWKGLNTADNRATFNDGFLFRADNIDIMDPKTLVKRSGIDKFNAAQPTGAAARIHLLGRHKTSSGDKIYFQTVDGSGIGLKVYRCNLDQSSVQEVTIAAASITGSLYGYQYNDLFYIVRSAATILSVTMASAAASSVASSPSGSQVIAHKGRLWVLDLYGTFGSSVTRVYYSTTSLTWGTGDAGNIDINFGDGKPVVAAAVLSDLLIIFKQDSTWSINADSSDPGDWVVRLLNPSVGCIARDSLQIIDGEVYFLSQRGVYHTDGITYTEISNNIRPSLLGGSFLPGNASSYLFFASAYFENRYILSDMWFAGGTNHLVYNTRTGAWTLWTFGGNITSAGLLVIEDFVLAGQQPGILIGNFNNSGYIYRYRDTANYQDDGNNFTVTIETGEVVQDTPSQFKRCIGTDLDVKGASTTSGTITLRHTIDNDMNTADQSVSTLFPRAIQRFAGPGYHRYMRHKITAAGNFPLEIFSITDWMSVKDRVSYAH